jgi:glycosyltransferase involved in cell wall biosynthesis
MTHASWLASSRRPWRAEGATTAMIRLLHLFSSDLALPGATPYALPLVERGWDVTFMSPDGPLVSTLADKGIRFAPLDFTRRMDPLGDAVASAGLLRKLLREHYDVIHTHNVKVGLVGRVLAGVARAPVIVHTLHGSTWSLETPEPKRSVNALLERIASIPADLLFAQSQNDYESFVKMRVVPPRKIRIIGNGVDLRRFNPESVSPETRERERAKMGVSGDEVLVTFAGRIVREKGIEEVYAAAEMVGGEGIRVAVVGRDDVARGDGPSADAAERARRGRVIFLGERSDMPVVYAASDVVGLASWREGMPRVLIEGAAMKKPLLATDIRGSREIVKPGVTGIFVPVRDPQGLAEGIRRLARDAAMRRRLGDAAREDALARFDLAKAVGRVVGAYDELLDRRGVRS